MTGSDADGSVKPDYNTTNTTQTFSTRLRGLRVSCVDGPQVRLRTVSTEGDVSRRIPEEVLGKTQSPAGTSV